MRRPDDRTLAGLLFFAGAVQFLVMMVAAEGALPEYSASRDAISDLGVGPTAALFNGSVFLAGLLTILGGALWDRVHGRRALTALLVLAGAGAMGVGVFPETLLLPHAVSALLSFIFMNVAAVVACLVTRGLLRWIGVLLGATGLAALGLFLGGAYLGIGFGGMERMIVYPALFWETALAGQLLSPASPAPPPAEAKDA